MILPYKSMFCKYKTPWDYDIMKEKKEVRKMSYTKIAIAKPFEGAPKINLCACYGASPQKPILLKIPVIGQRPITYLAENLPDGLTLEKGILTGRVEKEGVYEILLNT